MRTITRRIAMPGVLLGAGLGLALALGCGGEERTTSEDVERETSEAAETTGEYLASEKEVYQEKLRERLDALDERIGESEGEATARLRESREEVRALLERVSEASGDEWERVKRKVDETLASVAEAYEGATSGG